MVRAVLREAPAIHSKVRDWGRGQDGKLRPYHMEEIDNLSWSWIQELEHSVLVVLTLIRYERRQQ